MFCGEHAAVPALMLFQTPCRTGVVATVCSGLLPVVQQLTLLKHRGDVTKDVIPSLALRHLEQLRKCSHAFRVCREQAWRWAEHMRSRLRAGWRRRSTSNRCL